MRGGNISFRLSHFSDWETLRVEFGCRKRGSNAAPVSESRRGGRAILRCRFAGRSELRPVAFDHVHQTNPVEKEMAGTLVLAFPPVTESDFIAEGLRRSRLFISAWRVRIMSKHFGKEQNGPRLDKKKRKRKGRADI